MILNLNFREIELLIEAIDEYRYQVSGVDYRVDGAVMLPGSTDPKTTEDIAVLTGLESRLEAIATEGSEAIATGWETEIKNERGNHKFWYRVVEVRIFAEVLYVFRVRAESIDAVDPIRDHAVKIHDVEYRSTAPAPAEVHLRALTAFKGVAAWMLACGLDRDNVRKGW